MEGEECDVSRQRRGGSLELKQLADRGAHIPSNDPHTVSAIEARALSKLPIMGSKKIERGLPDLLHEDRFPCPKLRGSAERAGPG